MADLGEIENQLKKARDLLNQDNKKQKQPKTQSTSLDNHGVVPIEKFLASSISSSDDDDEKNEIIDGDEMINACPVKIGKGGFGIAFMPRIPCKNSSTEKNCFVPKNQVSKIVKDTASKKEIENYNKIETIDPQHLYHIPLIKTCEIGDISENIRILIDNKFPGLPQTDLKNMVFPYGGETIYFKNSITSDTIMTYFHGLLNILYGAQDMNYKKFIHFDIKQNNIVFDKNQTGKFIDFGLSSSYDNYYSNIKGHTNIVQWWPPELYFLINQQPGAKYNNFIRYLQQLYKHLDFFNFFADKYIVYTFIKFVKKYINVAINLSNNTQYDYIPSFIEKVGSNIDSWSLSIMILDAFTILKQMKISQENLDFMSHITDYIKLYGIHPIMIYRKDISYLFYIYVKNYIKYIDDKNIPDHIMTRYNELSRFGEYENLSYSIVYNRNISEQGRKNLDAVRKHLNQWLMNELKTRQHGGKTNNVLKQCGYKPSLTLINRKRKLLCALISFDKDVFDEMNKKIKYYQTKNPKVLSIYKRDLDWIKKKLRRARKFNNYSGTNKLQSPYSIDYIKGYVKHVNPDKF